MLAPPDTINPKAYSTLKYDISRRVERLAPFMLSALDIYSNDGNGQYWRRLLIPIEKYLLR